MTGSVNRPIDPLLLAKKMQGVRNCENETLFNEFRQEPRLIEALWALQFFSRPARPKPRHQGQFIDGYPGGLRAFTGDLINDSLDLIGTRQMRLLGAVRYDRPMASAVYSEIPSGERALGEPGESWLFDAVLCDGTRRIAPMSAFVLDDEWRVPKRASDREINACVKKANREAFLELCINAARESLVDYLRGLCELPRVCFHREPDADRWTDAQAPWYFAEIGAALLRFIDRRAEKVQRQIADTEIAREVRKWLGRAQVTRSAVFISGNSRFGKTEAVQAFCEAYPGRARLVETPSSNSESDLLRAVANAIGLEIGPRRLAYQLREEIGYLVEQAGLMLVFDEAQAIFPSSFGRNTAPARLNWIRRAVLDRGIPAAFICTPQSYDNARKKFLRVTNFAMEQWDERLLKLVQLPEEVAHEDWVAIARIRLPGLHSDYLEYIVSAVKLSGRRNYVSDVSRIAALARFNAEESGRAEPNFADIKAAIADVLPAAKPTADDPPLLPAKPPSQARPRRVTASIAHAHRARSVTPKPSEPASLANTLTHA